LDYCGGGSLSEFSGIPLPSLPIVSVFAKNIICLFGTSILYSKCVCSLIRLSNEISEASRIRPSIWEAHLARDLDHDLEGGESISQFAIRIEHALERIKQAHIGKIICLVSHGGVLDMIYRIVSQQALNTHRVASVPNASLNHIAHDGQRWMIEKWADTSHLMDAALDNVDL